MRRLFRSRREDAWRDSVLAKLDHLSQSQNQIRTEMAELSAEERPKPFVRMRVIVFFMTSLVLTSALEQTLKDMQPLTVEKNGVQSLNPDPPNSLLPNIESAKKSADQFSKYAAEQRRDNIEYLAAQYGGQIILAIGSAFIGALAGWLIIPMLVERRSSRRND
jgi:hypothetical protein